MSDQPQDLPAVAPLLANPDQHDELLSSSRPNQWANYIASVLADYTAKGHLPECYASTDEWAFDFCMDFPWDDAFDVVVGLVLANYKDVVNAFDAKFNYNLIAVLTSGIDQ